MERAVEEANARTARAGQIERFSVLPTDWEPGGDELTPTAEAASMRRPPAPTPRGEGDLPAVARARYSGAR